MAGTTYTRQSTFIDGDVINASLFNNEYNQLENAFIYAATGTTGHQHDGTNGQGGNIYIIGDQDFLNKIEVDSSNNRWGFYISVGDVAVEQIRLQDGAIVPVTDNDIDLGTSSLEFKNIYIDGTANIDTLAADTGSITGDFSVGGNLTVTGNATINGNLTFGDAATDTVAFSADINSSIIPETDNTYDLGSVTQEWRNLYIDGTANIDSLVADTADINGGTIDSTAIGSSTASTGNFSTLSINGTAITATAAELNVLDGITATTAELNYTDGVTSNIQTQLNTKAPIASPTFTGTVTIPTVDINAGAIDNTTIGATTASSGNFSTLSINGTAITATATEINYLDGVTSNIQTQIDALQDSDADLTAIAALTPTDGVFIVGNGSTWVAESGATVRTSLGLTIGTDVAPIASPTFTGTVTIPAATVTGDVSFGDNDKATFGADNDLEIYHNGTDSIINDNGTGSLKFQLGGSTRLETTPIGIDVTGFISTDGLNTSGDINVGSSKAIFGTNAIEIYADVTYGHIDLSQALQIKTDTGIGILTSTSENIANFNANGAVNLWYDGSKKFETTSTGIDVTGIITTDGMTTSADINFADNGKAIFGDGSDLSIYHNGTQSIIEDQGTGGLLIKASANLQLRSSTDEVYINCVEDAQVSLKYNNNTKLDTTSTGIDVTGTATMDGLTVDGDVTISDTSVLIDLMETDTTDVNTRFQQSSGDFLIRTLNDAKSAVTTRLSVDHATGDISFYEDTGTTAKFFWDASAESLGIGTSSPQYLGHFVNGDVAIVSTNTTNNAEKQSLLFGGASGESAGLAGITGYRGASASAGELIFKTNQGSGITEAMRIDSSGNVGIGTDDPAGLLTVNQGAANGGPNAAAGLALRGGSSSVYTSWLGNTNEGLEIGPTSATRGIQFWGGGSEAMRIDSSGNLLVGTTVSTLSSTSTETGLAFLPNGASAISRSGLPALYLNRLTSDGDIVQFRKDGTTVGSIGTTNSDLTIGTGDVGFRFRDGSNDILPFDIGSNSATDDVVSFGSASTRFKDAHFSGTVNAANISETVYALSGTALDPANGGIQTKTLAANTTFTDSLASGESLVLQLEAGASYTVTWPTMQWVTSSGNVAPTLTAKDTLVFWKVSTTLYGAYTGSYV